MAYNRLINIQNVNAYFVLLYEFCLESRDLTTGRTFCDSYLFGLSCNAVLGFAVSGQTNVILVLSGQNIGMWP
jgi:hypothetical protein